MSAFEWWFIVVSIGTGFAGLVVGTFQSARVEWRRNGGSVPFILTAGVCVMWALALIGFINGGGV